MKYLFIPLLFLFLGCTASRPVATSTPGNWPADFDAALADSLLTLGFENEALYTLMADIKPISTLCDISFPLARRDSAGVHDAIRPEQHGAALAKLTRLQRVLDALETPDVGFVINPFRQDYDGKRIMQISVYRRSRIQKLIADNQAFFGQWGFVPTSEPEIVLNTIEFGRKYDRFRGYGYLFGYPRHAVNFFVESAQSEARTKKFVERDFFPLPVASGKTGRFTYAVPKGYQPTQVDSALYHRVGEVLKKYQALKPNYTNAQGQLRALPLWMALQRRAGR